MLLIVKPHKHLNLLFISEGSKLTVFDIYLISLKLQHNCVKIIASAILRVYCSKDSFICSGCLASTYLAIITKALSLKSPLPLVRLRTLSWVPPSLERTYFLNGSFAFKSC